MSNKRESNIPWWLIVSGFIFCLPVGILLLFLSIGGIQIPIEQIKQELSSTAHNAWERRNTRRDPASSAKAPIYTGRGRAERVEGTQNRTNRGRAQQKSARRFLKNPKSGKGRSVLGALLSFAGLAGLATVFTQDGSWADAMHGVPLAGGILCAGLFFLGQGIAKTRRARRAKLYQAAIGHRNSIFISDLAGTAGVSEKKCILDLQRLISDGILPDCYIDRASNRLILTDQGFQPPEAVPKQEPKKEPPKSTKEDPDNALLRQIREVNDAIPDEDMSRKIDRIEEITRRILEFQKRNPAKSDQLRQFLNYYLPTTLKILNTYAQMDAQGVEGENISAAKARIEGMMDKVVEGFEKQLDQLFQSDAMDITTDVDVLERMLEKDGLGSGLTMGGGGRLSV